MSFSTYTLNMNAVYPWHEKYGIAGLFHRGTGGDTALDSDIVLVHKILAKPRAGTYLDSVTSDPPGGFQVHRITESVGGYPSAIARRFDRDADNLPATIEFRSNPDRVVSVGVLRSDQLITIRQTQTTLFKSFTNINLGTRDSRTDTKYIRRRSNHHRWVGGGGNPGTIFHAGNTGGIIIREGEGVGLICDSKSRITHGVPELEFLVQDMDTGETYVFSSYRAATPGYPGEAMCSLMNRVGSGLTLRVLSIEMSLTQAKGFNLSGLRHPLTSGYGVSLTYMGGVRTEFDREHLMTVNPVSMDTSNPDSGVIGYAGPFWPMKLSEGKHALLNRWWIEGCVELTEYNLGYPEFFRRYGMPTNSISLLGNTTPPTETNLAFSSHQNFPIRLRRGEGICLSTERIYGSNTANEYNSFPEYCFDVEFEFSVLRKGTSTRGLGR